MILKANAKILSNTIKLKPQFVDLRRFSRQTITIRRQSSEFGSGKKKEFDEFRRLQLYHCELIAQICTRPAMILKLQKTTRYIQIETKEIPFFES